MFANGGMIHAGGISASTGSGGAVINASWPVDGDLILVAQGCHRLIPHNESTIYLYAPSFGAAVHAGCVAYNGRPVRRLEAFEQTDKSFSRCTSNKTYCAELANCYNNCSLSGGAPACWQSPGGCCPSKTSGCYNQTVFGFFECAGTPCLDGCNKVWAPLGSTPTPRPPLPPPPPPPPPLPPAPVVQQWTLSSSWKDAEIEVTTIARSGRKHGPPTAIFERSGWDIKIELPPATIVRLVKAPRCWECRPSIGLWQWGGPSSAARATMVWLLSSPAPPRPEPDQST